MTKPGTNLRRKATETRHHITPLSRNVKTGPMTVTRSSTADTCPKSCPLLDAGCYDQAGNGGIHRRKVDSNAYKTLSVNEFFEAIPDFSRRYRLNEGGDLWSGKTTEHIDADLLKRFSGVNKHWRKTPIVYTHKPAVGKRAHWKIRKANRDAIRGANSPYAINVSGESLSEVDEALGHGLDCVVVLPMTTGKGITRTPKGNKVVTCPATYNKTQCFTCGGKQGPLCARKGRDYAIGFPAHGASKKKLTLKILQQA